MVTGTQARLVKHRAGGLEQRDPRALSSKSSFSRSLKAKVFFKALHQIFHLLC